MYVRQYKNGKRPKNYERGGRVVADPDTGELEVIPPDDAAPVEAPAMAAEPEPAPPSPEAPNPLGAALEAQQRAEAYWRQPPPARSFAEQIAELREIDPFRHKAAAFHHAAALADGVEDNTEEMKQRVLAGIQREEQEQHRLAVANVTNPAPALMPRAPMPPESDKLSNLPPTMPPRKASIPMTAPPSRSTPNISSGKRMDDGRKMTLTAEERLIARNSIVDRPDMPKLSNTEKELMYARNKAKLQKMKASGEYRQTTEQDG